MTIKNRLTQLETRTEREDISPLWIARELTPGRYELDDGRVLNEAELDALPGSGPGLHGLIISYQEVDRNET